MNKLIQAFNGTATTTNGAKAHHSTFSACLDYFGAVGASRGKDIYHMFESAVSEDAEVAIRTLLWSRDIRSGSGERNHFRQVVSILASRKGSEDVARRIMNRIPELGRFDDLMAFWGTPLEKAAAQLWVKAIVDGNGLAAKWAPVKDKKGACPLRTVANMTEHGWRKFVVPRRKTVEQQMCAREWEEINYEHVPSVAASRLASAFAKNDHERYDAYRKSLEKGEAKANAGALFPYDPVKAVMLAPHGAADAVSSAQWESLRDDIPSDADFLPIIDVSGSMRTTVGGNPNLNCMMVATSLGMYMSERNKGPFKDWFMTFESKPQMVRLSGTFPQRVRATLKAPWGGSTNLTAAFQLLLDMAWNNKVPQDQMPKYLVVVSDMEFNRACQGGSPYEAAKKMYEKAGYQLPHVIFWRVDVKKPQVPVTALDAGTTLVSGFNTSLLKTILTGEMDPMKAMLEVVMVDRYNF